MRYDADLNTDYDFIYKTDSFFNRAKLLDSLYFICSDEVILTKKINRLAISRILRAMSYPIHSTIDDTDVWTRTQPIYSGSLSFHYTSLSYPDILSHLLYEEYKRPRIDRHPMPIMMDVTGEIALVDNDGMVLDYQMMDIYSPPSLRKCYDNSPESVNRIRDECDELYNRNENNWF